MPPYSIDTSGLTHAWRDRYPPDVFPVLWDSMDEAINRGDLLVSYEVYEELKKGGDDLYDWVHARQHLLVQTDEAIQRAVIEIMAAHPQWVPADHSENMVDPFVIAVALNRGCAVVSNEQWYGGPLDLYPERIKIPNVCHGFGVRHLSFLGMMRDAKWLFSR